MASTRTGGHARWRDSGFPEPSSGFARGTGWSEDDLVIRGKRRTGDEARLRQTIYPSWSPDGTRFVFVGWSGSDRYNIFTARDDGSDVEQITHTHGIPYVSPDWGTNAG